MARQRFTGSNAALLLIDHQDGTIGWVNSMPRDVLKRNVTLLAKAAKILGMPIVMTTSMESFVQGPLIRELAEIAPEAFESRIQRMGIIDAMEDEKFAAAVRGTGRKKLVLAGVTNDVCTVFPALSLVEVLLAVGAVAIVSTMSVVAWTKVSHNVQHQKVETDVRTVNAAISSPGVGVVGRSFAECTATSARPSRTACWTSFTNTP